MENDRNGKLKNSRHCEDSPKARTWQSIFKSRFPRELRSLGMTGGGGFTLIELLVAISIVAILSVIGLTAYNSVQARARDAKRLDDAKKIVTMIEKYYSEHQSYPKGVPNDGGSCPNPNSTWWCISTPTNTTANPWISGLDISGFPKGLPQDPINNNDNDTERTYAYTSDGNDYCLQIPQETNASKNDYYKDYWSNTWKLRFGPSGPKGGLCVR